MKRIYQYNDDEKVTSIGDKYGVITLTHYTSLKNLIAILKEGRLNAGCDKMVEKCRDAIYFTVLFDFHLGSYHKPGQYLLVFSPKLLEKTNHYFLNTGIKYGEKGDKSFNPIEFGQFRAEQMTKFEQSTLKTPYGMNEAVFLLDQIGLDEYLLEIRVVPLTKNKDLAYLYFIDQLRENQVPQKYIDRVINVKDFVVTHPSFNAKD